jgi:hypothetical protein
MKASIIYLVSGWYLGAAALPAPGAGNRRHLCFEIIMIRRIPVDSRLTIPRFDYP